MICIIHISRVKARNITDRRAKYICNYLFQQHGFDCCVAVKSSFAMCPSGIVELPPVDPASSFLILLFLISPHFQDALVFFLQ